ncbi:hypothetical protein [Serratia sp. Se-RSBMAAmG]|uniref:hypothetical protein n=1 Tax=Serratia sp. Se-RSBMAAmG TaxID=3043305 RepID=UPI0024AF1098|nr:hypothetical protein [Serratia sp. Se-RSBMAAmG]MDI6977215.1 hypothetical protein [Serratia sp. Se-RSBMAAmG]
MKDIAEKFDGQREYVLALENGAELGVVKSLKDVADVVVSKLPQLENYDDFKAVLKRIGEEDTIFNVSVVFEQAELDLDALPEATAEQLNHVFFGK